MINFAFAADLMVKIGLDSDAINFFTEMSERLSAPELAALTERTAALLSEQPNEYGKISAMCDSLAEISGYNPHSVTAFIWLAASEALHDKFLALGATEEIFLCTADDFRCKLLECREMHKVNGIFVRDWEFSFYKLGRFGLGRMQFELNTWWYDPIVYRDHIMDVGTKYIGFHIPSSGKPFDAPARADAYRRAVEFFAKDFDTPKIPIVCSSWLLDPKHQLCLPDSSNIRRFADDFELVMGRKAEKFTNGWRIFGAADSLPPSELPENSSLQRAYKKRLLENDRFYNGVGVFWVDNPRFAK